MNASKESCLKALEIVRDNSYSSNAELGSATQREYTYVLDFLEAASKKLPSEEAYRRAKLRRKALLKKVS